MLVLLLGILAAPSASAQTQLPGGQYLWAATADKVLVYKEGIGDAAVAEHPTQANGNLAEVNSQSGKWVLVPTLAGIDAFVASTGQYGLTFQGAAGGYRQVAAIPSWATIGSPLLYGLRSDGSAVDAFGGDPSGPNGTISLRGTATYMSSARPVSNDQIIVNVKENSPPGTYSLAVVDTHDNSIRYLTQGSNQLVNGIVWSPDGSHAYLSSTNPDGTGGFLATYTAATATVTRAPLAANQTAKQLVVNPDGTQVFVAAVNTVTDQGSYQIVNTSTLATVGSVNLGQWNTFGYGDVGPEGQLSMPPGPTSAQFGALQYGTTRFGGSSDFRFFNGSSLPFLSTLTVTLPSQAGFLSGFDQKTYPGLPFPTPVTFIVLDGSGQPIPDEQVTLTFDNDSATYTGWGDEALLVTDSRGEIVLPQIVAGPNPGPVSVVATVGTLKPYVLPLTIVAPAVPPSVTALAAGDGQVTVTFTPGDGHGIAPTGFTVTAYDSNTKQPVGVTATGKASPITVTGLTNGKSYTFTVTANSPVGDWTSAMSPAINAGIAASITGTPPPGEVGKPYTFTYTVTGAPTPTLAFDNDATPLPAGLTFDAATATISGTPTTAGSSYVSVDATNAVGTSENNATIVTTRPPPWAVRNPHRAPPHPRPSATRPRRHRHHPRRHPHTRLCQAAGSARPPPGRSRTPAPHRRSRPPEHPSRRSSERRWSCSSAGRYSSSWSGAADGFTGESLSAVHSAVP